MLDLANWSTWKDCQQQQDIMLWKTRAIWVNLYTGIIFLNKILKIKLWHIDKTLYKFSLFNTMLDQYIETVQKKLH